ncbi:hypothetical protein NKI41_30020 [Mesorhizobium sp. M0601]|uniref:hypothetical protein n=1 Tax=unclassified Mesorhizobium TaxID=325217 RepID=UPI003335DF8D
MRSGCVQWTTSGPILTKVLFRQIDDSNRGDHSRLSADDNCVFLYEFTAFEYTNGLGFRFSDTNQLIHNLKKKPSERLTKGGWKYKTMAIQQCAAALRQALNPLWLKSGTIVPVPSSKAQGHPDHDDRLTQIARLLSTPPSDVREIVKHNHSHAAAHESNNRPTIEELLAIYEIDEAVANSKPVTSIAIFDDVLTAGTHYRAMQIKLAARFPGIPIFGMFIARRAVPPFDAEQFAKQMKALFGDVEDG